MYDLEDILFQAMKFIDKNIAEKLTVEDIARHVYVSPAHLQCIFKDFYGMPIAGYVRREKMKISMELLRTTEEKVSDIAYDIGFEHESSFIRSFKREFGMTPSEVRKGRRAQVHQG